jgi:hypothetical protein
MKALLIVFIYAIIYQFTGFPEKGIPHSHWLAFQGTVGLLIVGTVTIYVARGVVKMLQEIME